MDKFTQKELLKLGFEKQYVPPEDNDGVNEYTYYYLGLDDTNYATSLISGTFENDIKEAEVTFFEGETALSKELIELLIKELKNEKTIYDFGIVVSNGDDPSTRKVCKRI